MKNLIARLIIMGWLGTWGLSTSTQAQAPKPPTTSQEQEMNKRNFIPKNFKTQIIVLDEKGQKRAEMIKEVYRILETDPTAEKLKKYIRDDYIQHSTTVPDGYQPLSMIFSQSVKKYPVAIDLHKIIVMGDWAFVHLNFRNLSSEAPDDLGIAAVDIYLFGPEGKIAEHWDVLQEVPTFSTNPHGMFEIVRKNFVKE